MILTQQAIKKADVQKTRLLLALELGFTEGVDNKTAGYKQTK